MPLNNTSVLKNSNKEKYLPIARRYYNFLSKNRLILSKQEREDRDCGKVKHGGCGQSGALSCTLQGDFLHRFGFYIGFKRPGI